MIKKDFLKLYVELTGMRENEALDEIDEFLETMKDAFKKYPKITFRNFGVFEVKETKERKVYHSWKEENDKKIIKTKPRKYVKFRVSKNIENMLYEK